MDDIEDQDHADVEPRGGSLPGIAAALGRPAGVGLAHWGGPAPRRTASTTASVKECGTEIPPER